MSLLWSKWRENDREMKKINGVRHEEKDMKQSEKRNLIFYTYFAKPSLWKPLKGKVVRMKKMEVAIILFSPMWEFSKVSEENKERGNLERNVIRHQNGRRTGKTKHLINIWYKILLHKKTSLDLIWRFCFWSPIIFLQVDGLLWKGFGKENKENHCLLVHKDVSYYTETWHLRGSSNSHKLQKKRQPNRMSRNTGRIQLQAWKRQVMSRGRPSPFLFLSYTSMLPASIIHATSTQSFLPLHATNKLIRLLLLHGHFRGKEKQNKKKENHG